MERAAHIFTKTQVENRTNEDLEAMEEENETISEAEPNIKALEEMTVVIYVTFIKTSWAERSHTQVFL